MKLSFRLLFSALVLIVALVSAACSLPFQMGLGGDGDAAPLGSSHSSTDDGQSPDEQQEMKTATFSPDVPVLSDPGSKDVSVTVLYPSTALEFYGMTGYGKFGTYGMIVLTGFVGNPTPDVVSYIQIGVQLKDGDGNLIATKRASGAITAVKAGMATPFTSIFFVDDYKLLPGHYTLAVTDVSYSPASAGPQTYEDMELVTDELVLEKLDMTNSQQISVVGVVKNTGSGLATAVNIHCVLRDKDGNALWLNSVPLKDMKPGESQDYTCLFMDPIEDQTGSPITHRVTDLVTAYVVIAEAHADQ